MTTMNDAPLGYMPIPTVERLADALANVRCFHDLSAELIAPELLKNLLAAIAASPTQQGEAVEVVAWMNTLTGDTTSHAVAVMDWDDESEPVQSLMTVAQHERIMAASVPAGCKVVLPEPDFALDGGSTPCYYAETIRALLTSAEGVKS